NLRLKMPASNSSVSIHQFFLDRLLGGEALAPVDKIYIELDVLTSLICNSDPFQKTGDRQGFDQVGLGDVERRQEAISVVEEYQKLMVVGKPGAGKTTFLKSLAVECIQPEPTSLFPDLVPLFVTLRDFAKAARKTQSWDLVDYLAGVLVRWKVCDRATAEEILDQGRSLILLDAMDEVSFEDLEAVIDAVRELADSPNRLIVTCRTQSHPDPEEFGGFIYVKVADFTSAQVDQYVENCFNTVDSGSQASLIPKLQEQLCATENKRIAELTTTPILLNLICLVFQDEQGNLPQKPFQLYKKGVRILLERLKRKPIDERLTKSAKEKFLADLALMLFEKNDYFPEERTLTEFIETYFEVEGDIAIDFLRAFETETGLLIERFSGVWSFSHLTLHEYFTALKIFKFSGKDPRPEIDKRLEQHVVYERWHEVLRLLGNLIDDQPSIAEQKYDEH
ncbi:NACHT domain-containing NTPase, partial [Leptolyngbyaceae cyanobacterium UHCC 1019]